MTDTIDTLGLTPEMLREFQSRFDVPAGATEEFHLFRVVPARGPAQPLPAQVPIGAKATLEAATELADRLGDNSTVVIQRRNWLVRDSSGTWRDAKPNEHVTPKDDRGVEPDGC